MISDYYGLTILNFPFGLIVSLIIFGGIIQTSNSFLKFKKIPVTKTVNILFPFLIFSLFISIVNLTIYINISFARITIYVFLFFFLYQFFRFYKNYRFKKNILNNFKFNFVDIFIVIFLACYLVISSLPISDADSLSYHSSFGSYLIKYSNTEWMKNTKFFHPDLLLSGTSEIINFIGLVLLTDNYGSYINFLSLIFIYYIFKTNFKKKKNIKIVFLLILSSPIILPMIFSQKIYILPSIILSSIIYFLFIEKKFSKIEFFLLFSSLMIVASYKTSFLIPIFIILVYLAYLSLKIKKVKENFFLMFASFILFLLPLIVKNLYFHNDFFPPLTGQILNINSENINNFANFIKNYDLQLNVNTLVLLPFLIFIPHYGQLGNVYFSLPNIGKIYGIQFYAFLFSNKSFSNKFLLLILISFISVLLLGNISTRWFLFIFFLIYFGFLHFDMTVNKIFLILVKLQIIIFSLFIIFYSILNVEALLSTNLKKKFLINNSNGFQYISKINSISKNKKLKKDEYVLYSYRSHFWTDLSSNHINIGSEWLTLFNFKNDKISINSKLKFLLNNKKIKMIVFRKKNNLNKILDNSFKNKCKIDFGGFSSKHATRNIFFSGEKEYNWVYFKNENFINCLTKYE